jgi:choline kinase
VLHGGFADEPKERGNSPLLQDCRGTETSGEAEASKELGNVISASRVPVRQALVLAAGNGDRFKSASGTSKLLQSVFGQTLIIRTLSTAHAAGITTFDVVVGYQAAEVSAAIERYQPAGMTVRFIHNPEWHLENGVSALAARTHAEGRFALLMGDHLFEPHVLARAISTPVADGESHIAAEATRVRMAAAYITAIGKEIEPYDALDTGLFVCDPNLFAALEQSRADGDTTLSGGIRRLAAAGLMRGVDIGGARWCDIDTLADLEAAEALLGAQSV